MLQVVAMENSAAMNIGVHVLFGNKVFSGICTREGLLGHMATLFYF